MTIFLSPNPFLKLIGNTSNLTYQFFNRWVTGALLDISRHRGFSTLHRAYNAAVGELIDDFLANNRVGSLGQLSIAQARELATRILDSANPAIRGFLVQLGVTRTGETAIGVLRGLINRIGTPLLPLVIIGGQDVVICGYAGCLGGGVDTLPPAPPA
jgi:hypothetical protein